MKPTWLGVFACIAAVALGEDSARAQQRCLLMDGKTIVDCVGVIGPPAWIPPPQPAVPTTRRECVTIGDRRVCDYR